MIKALRSLTQTPFDDTAFITGLRAYAAMLVIMIHAGGAGLRSFGETGERMANLGATGVYIFFVISGFCIAHSFTAHPNLKAFWWKRFWRIAPLYYATCALGLVFIMLGNPTSGWHESLGPQNLFYDIAMHATFLSFLDYRIANSLIGVEWSIPIEMAWYLVLPFAVAFMTTWKRTAILFILTCAIFSIKFIYGTLLSGQELGLAIKWSPVRYAPAFFLGILAYKLRPVWKIKSSDIASDALLLIATVLASVELIWLQIGNEFLNVLLLSFAILILGGRGVISKTLFENKTAIYLGTISYSLYLTHMFVIALLPDAYSAHTFTKFLVISGATIAISTLTYLFIEQKALNFAKKLTPKILEKST